MLGYYKNGFDAVGWGGVKKGWQRWMVRGEENTGDSSLLLGQMTTQIAMLKTRLPLLLTASTEKKTHPEVRRCLPEHHYSFPWWIEPFYKCTARSWCRMAPDTDMDWPNFDLHQEPCVVRLLVPTDIHPVQLCTVIATGHSQTYAASSQMVLHVCCLVYTSMRMLFVNG